MTRAAPALVALVALASTADAARVEQVRVVMGSDMSVRVAGPGRAHMRSAVRGAFERAEELDRQLTTWNAASPISRVNAAAGSWVDVPPHLLPILDFALDAARRTDGAFDPTCAPILAAWGIAPFGDPEGLAPSAEAIAAARALVGADEVELDRERSRVRLARSGMALDFGAIGKGLAVDMATYVLRGDDDVRSGQVDASGTVLVFGPGPHGGAWRIGVRHPRDPSGLLTVLALRDVAVSTSGDYEKRRTAPGRERPVVHVVDPRTGLPVEGVASVTVVARNASEADLLSTALMVAGWPAAEALAARFGADALVVTCDPDRPEVLGLHRTPGFARWEVP